MRNQLFLEEAVYNKQFQVKIGGRHAVVYKTSIDHTDESCHGLGSLCFIKSKHFFRLKPQCSPALLDRFLLRFLQIRRLISFRANTQVPSPQAVVEAAVVGKELLVEV